MKPIVSLLAFALLVFAAQPSLAGESATVDVNGQSRTYLLYVPPGKEAQKLPAFLVFHGGGGSAARQEEYSGFDAFAAAHDLVAIYPEGMGKHWNDGRVSGAQSSADDIGFISALIRDLAAKRTIDPSRVYATGISNGGFMALHVACTIPDMIAGIGVIAAAEPADAVCSNPHPLPVIVFHGTADRLVPFDGGPVAAMFGARGSVISDAATASMWQKINGCGAATQKAVPNSNPSEDMRVLVDTYSCPPGHGLVNVVIQGGGHTWPGARQGMAANMILGPVTHDIDADSMMWDFFQAQISAH